MISSDDPRLQDRNALALDLAEAARLGAQVLLHMRHARDIRVKADGSPVCSADIAADEAAKAALDRLLPGFPVVSEESVDAVAASAVFILLDPLDGTREFLADGDSYCVAIAIIRDGRPIAGAIAAPQLGQLWYAGTEAFSQALGPDCEREGPARAAIVRPLPPGGPVTLVSRFHGDALSDRVAAAMQSSATMPVSSAVKFGLIATGEADLHIRAGQTMEWDIAAGDAILTAAGGVVLTLDGKVPVYGRSDRGYRNPPFLAASSDDLARKALAVPRD